MEVIVALYLTFLAQASTVVDEDNAYTHGDDALIEPGVRRSARVKAQGPGRSQATEEDEEMDDEGKNPSRHLPVLLSHLFA